MNHYFQTSLLIAKHFARLPIRKWNSQEKLFCKIKYLLLLSKIKSILSGMYEKLCDKRLLTWVIISIQIFFQGVLLMILFCLLQAEIRLHWSAVLTGSSRLKHRNSLSASKYEGVATTFDSRKASSAVSGRCLNTNYDYAKNFVKQEAKHNPGIHIEFGWIRNMM